MALKTGTQKGLPLPSSHKLSQRTGFVRGSSVFDMEAQREAWGGSGVPLEPVSPPVEDISDFEVGFGMSLLGPKSGDLDCSWFCHRWHHDLGLSLNSILGPFA